MAISIVPYSSEDHQGAKDVVLDGFKDFGFNYNPQYDSDLDDPSIYERNGGIFLTLKEDNHVIGTAAIINKGNAGELKRMYIDKNHQGKGYGSMLFEKAIEFCKEKGFIKLEFETNKKFTKAHEFYLKKGCKIVSEDDRSYYMEKTL